MYTTKLVYTDFDGKTQVDTLYFTLTEADITAAELQGEGIGEKVSRILGISKAEEFKGVKPEDLNKKKQNEMMKVFSELIDMSYGEKSADGRHFKKGNIFPEILADFKSSAAYSAFYMTLIRDADEAAKFINGIMPDKFRESAEKYLAENKTEG